MGRCWFMTRDERGLWPLLVCLAFAVLLFGCTRSSSGGATADSSNLLAGRSPSHAEGVRNPTLLTDGVVAPAGDEWKSDLTAILRTERAFVEYDLGSVRRFRAVWLMGDNNDTYVLSTSSDGETFEQLWEARPVSAPGLRERHSSSLDRKARFVRVSARGGDGSFSLAELQLFDGRPSSMPIAVTVARGIETSVYVRGRLLDVAAALILVLLLFYRRAPLWLKGATSLVFLAAAYQLALAIVDAWPLEQRDVSLTRFVLAVVAFAALLRERVGGRFAPSRRVVLAVLSLVGVLGVLAFFNLGHPQFFDASKGQRTYVHHLDLKQYYATAKYFPEIGYRGIYEADMAAYLEDSPGVTIESLGKKPMRSLRTHQMSTVGAEADKIRAAASRFSKERWENYKQDARYFRDAMGERRYFSTFYDLGGNATPVWIATGYLLFNLFDASDAAFSLTALLDPLLLFAAFVAIGVTFGRRTALVCMVIFGANDFIMYGSNWGGATLRHDWMAYLALGACALRRERWVIAGALLAMATSIRAFPALSLISVCIPAVWWIGEHLYERHRFPTPADFARQHRNLIGVAIGAAATGLALFVFASLMVGVSSWADWWVKVSQLSSDPHANHISLRGLVAGWGGDQAAVVDDRRALYTGSILCFAGLVFIGARRLRLEQAAILGLVMTPVLFYPANYYIHLIWMLPLVVRENSTAAKPFDWVSLWVLGSLLMLCAAQYFTVLEADRGIHFYMATVLLFAALLSLLAALNLQQLKSWFRDSSVRAK